MNWNDTFLALHDRCVADFRAGNHDYATYYNRQDQEFLATIGCQPREFFDFVEDFCVDGTPSPSTALLVAAARRDYFQSVQKCISSNKSLTANDLPTFGEEIKGLPYLPRILAKGRAKLRGELDSDLMYGCGGDRNFLKKHGDIHLADFLRRLWAAGDDDTKITNWLLDQND